MDGIISYNDSIPGSILSTVQDTCEAMNAGGWTASLELVGYQHTAHFPVIQASQGRWLSWVKDRLPGTAPAPLIGCAIGEVAVFRTESTAMTGPLPNFVVSWANRTNIWQYAL